MSDRDAFIRTICENPDDDVPRLVFADWLDEHEEHDRADLIRLQCRLAAGEFKRLERRDIQRRCNALIRWNARKWKAELPELRGIYYGTFTRGFVETVRASSVTALLNAADTLSDTVPVAMIRFTHWIGDPGMIRLAESPAAAHIRGLDVMWNGITDRGVTALADSPYFSELRVLELHGNNITDEGAESLLQSPYLQKLVKLEMSLWGSSLSDQVRARLRQRFGKRVVYGPSWLH